MSETKIVVPEGMLNAGRAAYSGYVTAEKGARRIIEAALRWLSENPIVPTDGFLKEMLCRDFFGGQNWTDLQVFFFGGQNWTDPQVFKFCEEWQRRMFLAPEPEVPEAIKDLLWTIDGDKEDREHNTAILEAYRRGHNEGSK